MKNPSQINTLCSKEHTNKTYFNIVPHATKQRKSDSTLYRDQYIYKKKSKLLLHFHTLSF